MRHLLLALAILACTGFGAPAFADGRAFPPDHCSASSPFMAFTGIDGSNTFCDSGQDILTNALLPNCLANQQVVFDGSKFICKDEPSVPTCPTGQVLTFVTGTGFTCVNPNATVPNCTAKQFLTYSGGAFQCANVQQISIPTCAAGQVVTADGSKFYCTDGGSQTQQAATCPTNCDENGAACSAAFSGSDIGGRTQQTVSSGATLPGFYNADGHTDYYTCNNGAWQYSYTLFFPTSGGGGGG